MADSFPIDVKGCARCGGDHAALVFSQLAKAIRPNDTPLTHWALCPTNGEPILLRVVRN